MKRNSLLLTAVVAASVLILTACGEAKGQKSAGGHGEAFKPKGNVTMVVPYGAGGGSDMSGRSIAAGLEAVVPGLRINTENRVGGSGAVGYSYFLSKTGDPNYLLPSETALLALPLNTKVGFDYTRFTPIMKVGDDFTLAVVPASSPWATCADLVNASKSGRVVAGISGVTGLDNVVFTLTEQATGAKFDRVPFESGDELLAALLGNQIQVASLNPGEVVEQLKAGKLKALCAFSEKRYEYPELKDIPTAKEQGIDVAFAQFRGLIAPGGISDGARTFWIDASRKFIESDKAKQYIASNYLQPNALFGDDFTAYLKENNDMLKKAQGK
ncbi:tripartite tricarboxylate transporter substrate binding protein [Micromonospora soli]|uniref:tripartite tricarboxylate transporter substrate binding protein n=1 Tax=Micromonospora sp. NBRC 110009 TaxID=3061627 RepID=UPI00267260C2|nr:tripartite tricarboxylate transporter substrate binding protein [Micromonospora sp. NBRC 110009]WKT98453.1 tripartite tricarboxylate transporter substrate binding protein [Micromonospora sp. NBRC 110009]